MTFVPLPKASRHALRRSVWDLSALDGESADVAQAAEVALFALKLAGQGRNARRGGRFSRLVVSFALAACLALATIALRQARREPRSHRRRDRRRCPTPTPRA